MVPREHVRLMPSGIDPVHYLLLQALDRHGDPLLTAEVHRFAKLGTSPSIEGVGRRLKTMQGHGWVDRADYSEKAAWRITDTGRAAKLSGRI